MQEYSLISLLIVLSGLILISSFFSGSEIAMMALNRYRLRHLVRQHNRSARLAQRLLERQDRLLGVILIGNTFANIVASAVATLIAVRLWGDVGVVMATIALTLVILIFAEIAPKTVAALHSLKLALWVCWPLAFLLRILYPMVWLANGLANAFLVLFGVTFRKQKEELTGDELRSVVLESSTIIPEQHRAMLLSILDLSEVTVDDIMVPLSDVVAIDLSEPSEVIEQQLASAQHTRMPIHEGKIDDVLGMIHMRDVMSLQMADDVVNVGSLKRIAQDIYYVPEGTSLNTQLLNFQKAKCRSAMVVDEYGVIQGLVTLEDILEEIVGEFTTDIAAMNKEVIEQEDGSFFVDGGITIRELNRILKWRLPEEGPKTLSGLVIEYLEFIPLPGTTIKVADHPIEVVRVKGNIIKTLRVR